MAEQAEKDAYRKGFSDGLRFGAWRRTWHDQQKMQMGENPELLIGKDHGAETTTLKSAVDGIPNLHNYDPEMK